MRRVQKNTINASSETFLAQGSGAEVQDMQYSGRVLFVQVTLGIKSHFQLPLVARDGGECQS